METPLYTLDGTADDPVELPDVFTSSVRPDLINRAVLAAQANRKQPHGADPFAGLRTSAESPGSGRGLAHVPRANNRGARVPQTVGGRKAHPPKADKEPALNINKKERKQAVASAIAATADVERVRERGHQFDDDLSLPLVVSNDFEDLVKTHEVVDVLTALGIYADIERAEETSIRPGRGTTRGRKYRRPSSILFITGTEPSKAARNLAGADVATGREVNAEDLAPGGQSGRLTLWTEHAIEEVAER